jgi:hypothetical protein
MNGLPEPYPNGTHVVVRGRTLVITDHAPNADDWHYHGTPADLAGDVVTFSHREALPVRRVTPASAACADCGSTGVLVERRGKMVCDWCANRYWPMTADERREIGSSAYAQELAALQAENVEPTLTPLEELLSVVEHIARRGHAELRQALNIYREATS